jgi:hypothetical protein
VDHSDLVRKQTPPGRSLPIAAADVVAVGFILLAVIVVFRQAFFGFFVQDDFGWLASSRFQGLSEYLGSFFRFNPALTYRPLSQETFFWVGQLLFGMWPPGFHAVSVLLHLTGCGLLYCLLRKFFDILPSFTGAFFFAVHGAHLRSVYWISAAPEPMALVFYLAALLLFVSFDRSDSRRAWLLSLAAMGLGILSKESILSLPMVLAGYCVFFARQRLVWTIPFFLISGAYAVLRLTSEAVRTAPYPLTFGWEALRNFQTYCSWAAGFTDTILMVRLRWSPGSGHLIIAAFFLVAIILMVLVARNRSLALFGLMWFLMALQPVLYFWKHIDAYYLAPSLAGLAMVIASAIPPNFGGRRWAAWIPVSAIVIYAFWTGGTSVRLEGRWWNGRSMEGRHIISLMPAVDRQVPPGKIAYVFGLSEWQLGILQNDAAFKAYGFSPGRFILMGLNPETPGQIRHLEQYDGLKDYYCFVYKDGQFLNVTADFRRRPRHFLTPVELQAGPSVIERGRDTLIVRILNLDVDAISVRYTLDGRPRPEITYWRLSPDRTIRLFVDRTTEPGVYRFTAIRDAADPSVWYPVDAHVTVR